MKALFFGWVLPASAAGGAAVLLVALTAGLLLRLARPVLLRRLCTVALALFWLPVGWFRLPEKISQPVIRRALPGPLAAADSLAREVAGPLAQTAPLPAAVDWRGLAVLLWAAVGVVLLILFAADLQIFRRQAARASVPAPEPLMACLADAAAGLGIKKRPLPRLWSCGRVGGPMLVGFFRPAILLPEQSEPGRPLRCALAHELCHWRAGDLALKGAALFTAAVHWYNPAAWLLVLLLERGCEYACDAAALAGAGEEERFCYGSALLELHAARAPITASGFSAAGRRLKRRLSMILQPEKKNTPARRALAGLIVLCILAAGLACGCTAAEAAGSSQPASSPVSSAGGDSRPATDEESGPQEESQPAADMQSLVFPVGEGYNFWSRGFAEEHPAVDLAARYASPICAAASGTVLEATRATGTISGLGIYIVLDHGGWQTVYGHCSALAVEPGQQVEQGEVIGYVGATGDATGNLCHFELIEDGEPVDPAPLLGLE